MTKGNIFIRTVALSALLVLLSIGTSHSSQNTNPPSQSQSSSSSIIMDARGTYPTFITFQEGSQPTVALFFDEYRTRFSLSRDIEMRPVGVTRDNLGQSHHRFQEYYKGIEVIGGEYILHEDKGLVKSANGLLVTDLDLDATSGLSENGALQRALDHVGATVYMWDDPFWEKDLKERTKNPDATYFPRGVLCWIAPDFNLPGRAAIFTLAYRFDIHAASPNSAQRVYVSATSGVIVNTVPLESNCSAATVNTNFNGSHNISTDHYTASNFRLRDDCQAATIRVRNWNSTTTTASPLEIENTTNTWTTMNEQFGGTVLWETKESYLYFLNSHGRSSYDNANGGIEAYINAVFACTPPPTPCYSTDNASMSFSGGTMKVGLGSSGTLANSWSTLDIIAHEYTHAVTGSSANLTYANESGALNESFSDIFGETIESNTLGTNDWLMGSERTSGAIRSLLNPNAFNDPDTYLGTNWYTGTNDNGGVHTNSGVQNFWYYLLAIGGSGTNDNGWAYSFSGIGLAKAAAIAYRNLTVYLTSSSSHSDARVGAIAAAGDLYGAGSTEQQTVRKAWRAVGIDPCVITCPANVTASNDAGQCGAIVTFPAPTTNGECDVVTTIPPSGSFFPVGTTAVTSTATSGASCSFTVTVNDVQPPVISCPANIARVNDPGQCGAVVTFSVSATDNCSGVTLGATPPSGSFFPVGSTTVTCTASDVAGNTSLCTFTVTVNDVEPPSIAVTLDPNTLWPPNHTLRNIAAAVTATDNCSGVTYALTSITSSEPDNGLGDGDRSYDIVDAAFGTPDLAFRLRSERSGRGSGRTYTVTYTAIDGSSNSTSASATVTVAHDMQGSVAATTEVLPETFALYQNHPNPFNPTTTITYALPVDAYVSLAVYNALGQKVAQLVEGGMSAGYHNVVFDATDMSSGIYIYTLYAGDFVQTKKLVLMK